MEELHKHISDANIRQSDFASQIGISGAFLSQILKGTRRPSYDVMLRIDAETNGRVPLGAWQRSDATAKEAAQ